MTMLEGIIFLRGKLEAIGLRFPPKGKSGAMMFGR